MEEQVLTYVKKLKPSDVDEGVQELLCRCACRRLDSLLAEGVSARDCGESYPLAAAWMVLDWLEGLEAGGEITAVTAGDLTVRREREDGRRYRAALDLMAPYLKDEGFVFRGVRG